MLLDFSETKKLLEKYNLPIVESLLIETAEQGIEFAQKHGFPVVLKILSPNILHKIDKGLVRLNIQNKEQLCKELEFCHSELASRRAKNPAPDDKKIIIQKQIAGIELFCGMKRDKSFGPVLSFGLGGIFVETLKDLVFLIPPFSQSEIKKSLQTLKAYEILKGARAQAPVNEKKLIEIIMSVAKLALENPQIQEIDLNPLIAEGDNIFIVDPKLYEVRPRTSLYEVRPRTDLGGLFNPKSVALVGATTRPGSVGLAIAKNLLAGAKARQIFFVNPNRQKVLGQKCYKTILDVPAACELAIIAVPAAIVPQVSEQCANKKIKSAIIISSGFAETDKQGAALQEKIRAIFQKAKIPFLGPNCLGVVNPWANFNGSFAPAQPAKGSVAFISQSGALIDNLIDVSLAQFFGFSAMVSFGNSAGIKITDLLDYFGKDEKTKVIAFYLEAIEDGEEFIKIAKKISKQKPIVVLKAGATKMGSQAARSHTAALAGSGEIYSAAFKKAGVISARNLKDFIDIQQVLASQPKYKGGAGILTNAGALGVLAADACSVIGIDSLMPLDLLGDASPEKYSQEARGILRQKNIGCLIVIASFQFMTQIEKIAKVIVEVKNNFPEKAILCCLADGFFTSKAADYLRKQGIPVFQTPEAAVLAAAALRGLSS